MTIARGVAVGVAVLAAGCVLPAFSAGDGEGGAGSSTTTVTTTSRASSAAATTSTAGIGGHGASGGGAGGDGAAGQGGCGDVDLDIDPEHCGTCETSCLGAECVDGVCLPLALADSTMFGYGHLAVGGSRIYWDTPSGVAWLSTSITETTIPELIAFEEDVDMLAADDDGVYFATRPGAVVRAMLPDLAPELVVSGQQQPIGLVVHDGILRWTEYREGAGIWSVSTLGGEPTPTPVGVVNGIQVAADGEGVFLSYHGGAFPNAGGVVRSDGLEVAIARPKPSGIALSATHVYWQEEDASVWRRPRTTVGEADQVAPAHGTLTIFNGEVVTDGSYVYWAAPGGRCDGCGAVFRAHLGGGEEPELFADVSEAVAGLAVDDVAVYWTTDAPAGLYRKAKRR